MENIGETFRILRKERGFTLKTMSKGIVSYSYLSKFEKGQSQITLANFVQLAQRLNMTVDEILYFNNTKMVHYVEFFQKVSSTYAANDITALKTHLRTEENLYKKTKINYHKYNSIMIAVIIKDLDNDFYIPEKDVDLLVDYLIKCSFWTIYEVSLFGNILPLFSDKMLIILLQEIKKRISEYKILNRNYRELIGVIQNACIIFLRKKKVQQALSLSNSLEKIIKRIYYFEKTRKMYIDGVIEIALGNSDKGKEKARKAIQVMSLVDEQYAKDHELELEKFRVLYITETA